MTIQTLIDKRDTNEIVLEAIGAILLAETTSQQALALAAAKDPRLWALRIFTGASNPWEEFRGAPDQLDATPIVNVTFDAESFDRNKGNVFERQMARATFNVDCYGYGVSEDDGADGHTPGDQRAHLEVLRVARLVRNMLMAATYVSLQQNGLVGARWIESITAFRPPPEARNVNKVDGARIVLSVDFVEFAPQVQGPPLALISVGVRRRETGELYFEAS
ncbi:MAG: hypothetical protein JNM74_02390, partial [Myxococcales bacterium]|nr:hypothetical protein [Myxococcales bacterium]